MSPTTTTTRPSKNDCDISLVTAWFRSDFVKHILATQRFGYAFGSVLTERMIRVCARDLKHALIQHHDTERSERHARREDRKSTRLNSSHGYISYAVFCLNKKNNE